jgi:hypothetical protein
MAKKNQSKNDSELSRIEEQRIVQEGFRQNRRRFLNFAGQSLMGGASLGIVPPWLSGCAKGQGPILGTKGDKNGAMNLTVPRKRKFLFVFTAMGGASINDSFLAVRESECQNKSMMNVYPDALVSSAEGTGEFGLRAVDLKMKTVGPLPFGIDTNQSKFLGKYGKEILVVTLTGNTVAHPVGQARCVNGFEAWNGRTLQEAVAEYYGQDLLIPNVTMGTLGFAENGKDPSLKSYALAEQVSNAALFPFGLDGSLGIQGAPKKSLINIARRYRDERLDQQSPFAKTFGSNPLVQDWIKRRQKLPEFENRNLINLLNPYKDTTDFPFKEFGFEPNPQGELLRQLFKNVGPNVPLADDLENQTLLAYLLVASGLTCAVTFGLGMNVGIDATDKDKLQLRVTPTGFDYSHNAHRGTQALLWHRTLDMIDRLITLLRSTELAPGETFWDHSLIYIATEFGRDKNRPANESDFTSGHHTNNAMVVISPLVNGGRILGGIDRNTLLTYGFDPETGEPEKGRNMEYKHIYAGILQSMGVDTSGSYLPNMKAMVKKT